ncbi:hypothetical protein N7517_002902 [Penicillium concentricum]|uniref:BTB domain-containing protein n=1 Tax=Penicillium concentricum TaxID=293559 RepID=A0A9W9SUI9_9EURO|nr:uncharacterized protein N7517_002902 [Penicillium concentricum]KAJ5384991.1 hypothetical protein N7517_002902 [Penicillium concentricum]
MDFSFASPSNVTLTIIEEPNENNDNKTKTALFHVDRSKLIESSAYFQSMLSSRWERAGNHNQTLKGDTIQEHGSCVGIDPRIRHQARVGLCYRSLAHNQGLQ